MMSSSWALVSACGRAGAEAPGRGRGARAVGGVPGLSTLLAAGDGRLHKAVSVGPRVHIIEELQVFPPGQPVQNLLLDPGRVSRRKGPVNALGAPLLRTSVRK